MHNDEFAAHPAGQIETSTGHESLARAAALAGLTNLSADGFAITGTPTTVTMKT
jgi:hypothetical protein